MVRFVDDHDVPTGGNDLVATVFVVGQKRDTRESELRREERIFTRITLLERNAALRIVDGKPKIETTEQLDEPLMDERFRHENQRAPRFAGHQQTLQDQTRLDRF